MQVPLCPPIGDQVAFDLTQDECFSTETFLSRAAQYHSQSYPYFIAAVFNDLGRIEWFDGYAYLRNKFQYDHSTSPLTNVGLTQIGTIYRIDRIAQNAGLHQICQISELRNHNDHLIKFITAHDLDLDPHLRCKEEHYLGLCHLQGIFTQKNPEEAKQWFLRAAAAGYVNAYVQLIFPHIQNPNPEITDLIEVSQYLEEIEQIKSQTESPKELERMNKIVSETWAWLDRKNHGLMENVHPYTIAD